jgi:uncharacterized protein DUF3489
LFTLYTYANLVIYGSRINEEGNEMTGTYIVSPATGPGARMPVTGPYETREAARDAATPNDYVIGSEHDVIWSGAVLVEVFNSITESGIKKFESHAIGVKRLLAVLPAVARQPNEDTMATKEERAAAKLAKAQEADAAKAAKAQEREAAKAAKAQATADAKAAKAQARADKKAATLAAKPQREVKLGAFAQVRESSALGQVAKAVFAGGATLETLAAAIAKPADAVTALLKRARVTHGIDYAVAEDGAVTLVLPAGKTEADVFKVPAAPRVPSTRKPRDGDTKANRLVALVSRSEGATMEEMLAMTGWKACRGQLGISVGAAGKVLRIERGKGDTPSRYYADDPAQAAAE